MQEIKTLDNLKQQLVIPIIFNIGTVTISSINIEFLDLIQIHSFNQNFKIQNIQKDIQFLNFTQLRLLLNATDATNLDTLLSNVYFNSDLYNTTIHKCNITYNFSDGSSQITTRYFVIPTIENIVPPTTLIDLKINNDGTFNSSVLINENDLTSLNINIIQSLKYTDVSLYNTTITDLTSNLIGHNFSITNKDMYEIIVFLIGTYTNGTIGLVNWSTIQQTMQLVPVINFTKNGSSVDSTSNTKSIDCMLKIECMVFDGLNYVDYGNIFYRNGFALSADAVQNPVFEINKTIGT